MLKYMIGIDAGGTHSTAIAYDENGKELGRAESGPGQINNDYELGIKNIAQAVNELRDKIAVSYTHLDVYKRQLQKQSN